jgi:uncharacterized protein YecE (DUF72 family)
MRPSPRLKRTERETFARSKSMLDLTNNVESKIHIGTCAWSHEEWRGPFYPPHLPHNKWLEHYSARFRAVEVDSTFYHTPSASTVEHWLERTPEDFIFTCKMPREITHDLKLRNFTQPLDHFLRGIEPLRPKLGCIVVQLPPYFHPAQDSASLRTFVRALPADFHFAIEFRQHEWNVPRTMHLLQENGVSWVWSDVTSVAEQNSGAFEFLPLTTGFIYVRLLGDPATKYGPDGSRLHRNDRKLWSRAGSLENWALKIRRHLGEVDGAFVFVGNHFEGFSPETCARMGELLGCPVAEDTPGELALAGRQRQLDLL